MNPLTCGVAKFNFAVAKQLGVPCIEANYQAKSLCRRPLISIKIGEWTTWDPSMDRRKEWWEYVRDNFNSYELFFHDTPAGLGANPASVIRHAWRVFAADAAIAVLLRPTRPDVITAFCPGTIHGDASRGGYRVLVFGMASKLSLKHFEVLKVHLEDTHPDYTVCLSTAVHEGNPWDLALQEAVAGMRSIFGDRLRVLGFLGDDALAKELQECDAVAAYYEPALRANNTTAWAALAAGKKLYTNTDEYSPALDADAHSWPKLVDLIRG